MTSDPEIGTDSRVRLPDHVVYRSFVAETVVLNLQTGTYHGLNPMGGRMLETLNSAPSVQDAVASIATDFEQPPSVVQDDLLEFCRDLLARGLVEVVDESSHRAGDAK